MLIKLKKILMEKGFAGLDELSATLKEDPKIVSDMLERWKKKGYVKKERINNICKLCELNCNKETEYFVYKWIDKKDD